MNCSQCGQPQSKFDVHCRACGHPVRVPPAQAQVEALGLDREDEASDPFNALRRSIVPRNVLGEFALGALDMVSATSSLLGAVGKPIGDGFKQDHERSKLESTIENAIRKAAR